MSARLALFVPNLHGGGAERVMVILANTWAREGFPVDLVVVAAEGPYLNTVSSSVRLIDLKRRRVRSGLPGLVRYLRRERPCGIVAALGHANLIALWARSLARVPTRVVVTEHLSGPKIDGGHRQSVVQRLVLRLTGWFYRHADAVVAVSEGVADDLAAATGLPRERINVIYNPVVTAELLQQAEEPVAHPWFRAGEPPVVLSAGRLTAQKDYPTLIRAFARVRELRSARLMILGEGEDRPRLEALARELGLEDQVALPGFVENPFAYMRRAAVFVLSSAWEGLPTVLIEAIACGCPVISTDCRSGPREILKDGRWGRLVPVRSVERVAAAILDVLEHPPSGAACAEVPHARFAAEHASERYRLLLQGLVGV